METISGATFAFFHEGPPDLIENDLTNGSYRVMVGQAPVSEGPPMHVHPHTDEGFYIADGEMVFVFPDREVVAGANTFVSCLAGASTPPAPRNRCAACSSTRLATPSTSHSP